MNYQINMFNYINDLLLFLSCGDTIKCIEWMQKVHLLPTKMICKTCDEDMESGIRKSSNDGYAWLCRKCSRKFRKFSYHSIRKNSYFKYSNISLAMHVMIIYEWSYSYGTETTARRLNLSNQTTGMHFRYLRDVCSNTLDGIVLGSGERPPKREKKLLDRAGSNLDEKLWRDKYGKDPFRIIIEHITLQYTI